MGHALTSTKACDTANAMAIAQSKLGAGAQIASVRRKAWNSHDLSYVVEGAGGDVKEVVVTDSALKRKLARMVSKAEHQQKEA